tara:strand:+ start:522 stop:950 length:429 start_codon:yes stop_codon:yes gene_type:complete
MSSLNIKDLNNSINKRHLKRLELYNSILEKVHHRIKYNAELEKTFCFYNIPEFIIGTPLYNVEELKNYIITALKKNGFMLLHIEPNWLFISWNVSEIKEDTNKGKKKKEVDYKLVEEYKPSGQFVYNDYDLSSIKEKTNKLV